MFLDKMCLTISGRDALLFLREYNEPILKKLTSLHQVKMDLFVD